MNNAALEIPALLAQYADAFDAGDFEGAARMFEGGCVEVEGREISGADQIVSMWLSFVKLYEDGTPKTRHLVTNPAITLSDDGTAARCLSQWTVLQQAPGAVLTIVGTGRYDDQFRYDGSRWRFHRRTYASVDFWGDASAHLKNPHKNKEKSHGNL